MRLTIALLGLAFAACTTTKPQTSGPVSPPSAQPHPVLQNPHAGHGSVAPGEHVGPLRADSTRADLAVRLGDGALTDQDLDIGEGQMQAGTVIHAGTDHELRAVWMSPARDSLSHVQVIGRAWELPGGLHPGAPFSDVTSSLGAFTLTGFTGDNSGFIDLAGTSLATFADTTSLRLTADSSSAACQSSALHAQKLASDAPELVACAPSLGDVILRF